MNKIFGNRYLPVSPPGVQDDDDLRESAARCNIVADRIAAPVLNSHVNPAMSHSKTTVPIAQTTISAQLRQHCESFDIRDSSRVHQLVEVLDTSAQSFVLDPNARLITSFALNRFLIVEQIRGRLRSTVMDRSSSTMDRSRSITLPRLVYRRRRFSESSSFLYRTR